MISVSTCRQLLGLIGAGLGDPEIAAIRNQLFELATFVVALYATRPGRQSTADMTEDHKKTSALSANDREAVEERAAILESDARMPRDLATRIALRDFERSVRLRQE